MCWYGGQGCCVRVGVMRSVVQGWNQYFSPSLLQSHGPCPWRQACRTTQFDVHWKGLIFDKAEVIRNHETAFFIGANKLMCGMILLLPSPSYRLSSLLESFMQLAVTGAYITTNFIQKTPSPSPSSSPLPPSLPISCSSLLPSSPNSLSHFSLPSLSDHSWTVTGTPIQNKLNGYGLIRFIRLAPLDRLDAWRDTIIKVRSHSIVHCMSCACPLGCYQAVGAHQARSVLASNHSGPIFLVELKQKLLLL